MYIISRKQQYIFCFSGYQFRP